MGNTKQRMKPILFNTDMVRAILEGRKTSTRRVIKPQPISRLAYACMGYGCGKWGYPSKDAHKYWDDPSFMIPEEMSEEEYQKKWTPPCHTGDILYVRETWKKSGEQYYYRADFESDFLDACETISGGYPESCRFYPGCEGCTREPQRIRWYPNIHMPKEVARLFLRVRGVRVERLHDITEADAVNEGCCAGSTNIMGGPWGVEDDPMEWTAREAFAELWDITIKPSNMSTCGWKENPWVWVIEFERYEKPEEAQSSGTGG